MANANTPCRANNNAPDDAAPPAFMHRTQVVQAGIWAATQVVGRGPSDSEPGPEGSARSPPPLVARYRQVGLSTVLPVASSFV